MVNIKFNILLLSICAIICSLSWNIKVLADEADSKTIIVETDTSVVYDIGNKQAVQLPVNEQQYKKNPINPYDKLKVPAHIVRQGSYYFIVDTYRNQVLYSDNLDIPVNEWRVMTNDVELPHAIASDGEVYLVADTENNRVLVFEWINGRFQNTQRFDDIGLRPHYIKYDADTDSFFVWSAMTSEMYIIVREPLSGVVYIKEVRTIKELEGIYVRSFTILGEQIVFPSGDNSYIILADKNTLEVQMRYPVTADIAGMAYILPIGSYFYMTVSTDLNYNQGAAKIVRTKNLEDLSNGIYENIHYKFSPDGVPYYIEYINGLYYMTSHGSAKSIWRFAIENDIITYIQAYN